MAPPKAKEAEKDPWSWVPNCNPLEVTEEHVKSVYRINVPRCGNRLHKRNCKTNPYCLSRLGEEKWCDAKNFADDQVNDPEKERRKEGTYVGLKNLGATCYVNSLLQLWFHNLNFRSAIFKWDPLQDPLPEDPQSITVSEEKQILKQLQSVFALMQYGMKRFVDPTDFILSLRLDTSIQQDAQEFSKLFLSKLESVLSYQSQKEVRDLIKDNFCGEYVYVTRCMKCQKESKRPSKFYELDLNIIKGHKTIQDCLKDFMKVEILEGDNKYFCTACADKEDAQRFISLTELPPVLNLQLMRFFYDKNTGHKKKLNTAIQFPERLNMTEFAPNVTGELEYTLSAVLVHGGRSANSGHYVALICDSETGTWYKFNDESVEKIDAKKLKFAIEDECDETSSKKNKVQKAPPKGSYHSINAYMLVYTRVDPKENTSSEESTCKNEQWCLPPHLEEFVDQQNEHFEEWVTKIKEFNDATVGRSLNQQDEMISMITMLPVDSDSEDFDAVPTSCLTKWLSNPDGDFTIDNAKRTCEHGKLDPGDVSDVKYINSEIADRLFERYNGTYRFKACEFQCHQCVATKCFKMRVKSKITEEINYIQKRLKNFSSELEKSYWLGKRSQKSWRRLALDNLEHGLYNENKLSLLEDVHIVKNSVKECDADKENAKYPNPEHCRVLLPNGIFNNTPVPNSCNLEKATVLLHDCNFLLRDNKTVDISSSVTIKKEILAESVVNSKSTLRLDKSSANECNLEENEISNKRKKYNDNKVVNDISSCLNVPDTCPELENGLTPEFTNHVTDAKEVDVCPIQVPNHSEALKRRLEDDDGSSNAEMKFNEDILCSHGNLSIEESSKRRLVPEDVWRIFKKYFPSVKEFTSDVEPCTLCKNIASEDEVIKGKYRSRAVEEKEHLSELYHERSRPRLPVDIEYDCMFYILNKEFYVVWRKFIKEAGKKEPPIGIQNATSLLCPEHGKMLYDLNIEIPQSLMMFILPSEWEYLSSAYSSDQEISVHCKANGFMSTEPGVCEECIKKRIEHEKLEKLTYTNAKIYVHVVKEEIIEEASSHQAVDEYRPTKRAKLTNTNGKASNSKTPNGNENACNDSNGHENLLNFDCCSRKPVTCNLGNTSDSLINGNDSNNNDSNGNTLCQNMNNIHMNGNATNNRVSSEITAVRRSARSRRGDKKIEINVSSNLVLLDIKKKILEMMEVMPSDQHLFTMDGRELIDNTATLADLSIFPETVLTLKVDKPCIGNDSDDFSVCREREQGFVGTILTSGPCLDRCGIQNGALL